MKNTIITIASVTALASSANAQNFVNGDLTDTPAGTVVPTGWSVVTNSPDTSSTTVYEGFGFEVPHPDSVVVASPDSGGTFVSAIGNPSIYESFGQTVTGFTVGAIYKIEWNHANFGAGGVFTTTRDEDGAWRVSIDGGVGDIDSPALAVNTSWTAFESTFQATQTTHNFEFRVVSTTGAGAYANIDDISLTAVPEPSSTALLGLGALGLLVRRKR